MRRFIRTLILALIIFVSGWLLYYRAQINSFSDALELAQAQLGVTIDEIPNPFIQSASTDYFADPSWNGFAQDYSSIPIRQASATGAPNDLGSRATAGSTIRIASFKLDAADTSGSSLLTTDICGQFDVVAIQNLAGLKLSRLVNDLNQRGFDFRYVDRPDSKQELAIIFNQQTVVLEEQKWYTVNDPDGLFLHKPLVAWFRSRNAPDHLAFTFSLANLQLNPTHPDQEIAWLGELFRAIRSDGRGEDDIILAGDFYSNDVQLNQSEAVSGLTAAIVDTATNTRNDRQLDNIVFDNKATVEYTGASGAYDFMKRLNMTLSEALSISSRMPVWAEFSVIEGHSPGRAFERHGDFNVNH